MSGAVLLGSCIPHATSGAAAMNATAMPSPRRTCMRSPACWTARALSGSCAANFETVCIVPVTTTLLNSEAIWLTSEYAPNRARDITAGSPNWIAMPAKMK